MSIDFVSFLLTLRPLAKKEYATTSKIYIAR